MRKPLRIGISLSANFGNFMLDTGWRLCYNIACG